ncbi:hypothetical protein [Lentzea aerocolonigenes]|uniref:hypothetical protein n=1 Tax=Lentzea aerocolonigenes TaxID=68170 RepID=UPI0004C45EAD|nr:hypothetical protein [Lentzea aerocolonigenes]
MTEPVRREDTWHRTARDCYPDPYRIMRIQFPIVEELRGTPRETWPQPDSLPTALGYLAETFEDCGWDDLALRVHQEILELQRGRPEQTLRALTAIRGNLVRQELHEEAMRAAHEEYEFAKQRGKHEVAHTAKYWVTNVLGKLGRHEEAARIARESVAERREWPPSKKDRSAVYQLAHAHVEYAHRLMRIRSYEQAVAPLEEAAAFWRERAWDDAASLYTVLDELCALHLRLGNLDEALRCHTEGVAAIRTRAERRGELEFLGHLGGVLNNHGNRLHALGLDEEALTAAQESVEWYRKYAAKAPAPTGKLWLKLAIALTSLGSRLDDVGRFDEALDANDESIALITERVDGADGQAELARAWTNRASALIALSSFTEAGEAAAKGLELYHAADGKAMARNTFALASAHAGNHDVALEASLRSVAEYREWSADDAHEYGGLLADALTDHALIRLLRSERAEAEAAITESIALHETLVAANPGRYQRELDRARAVAARI